MHTLPCSQKTTRPLRRGLWAAMAIVCATLLGGCSIWPKALTFGSASEPVPAPEPTQAQTPPPAQAAPAASPPTSTTSAAMPTALEPQAPVVTAPLPEPAKADPTPAATATPPAKAPAQKPTKAGALVPGYYINVGLFAVPTNGTKAYKKLEDAGLPVFSDGIKTQKGNLTRVRVGPFTTQAEADAAAKQIRTLKLDAAVFKR